MERRTFLKGSLAALGLTTLGTYGVLQKPGICYAESMDAFTSPLPIPPLLENLTADSSERRHDN